MPRLRVSCALRARFLAATLCFLAFATAAARADDLVVQGGLAPDVPDGIAPDRFVVQWKTGVAHVLSVRPGPGAPRANLLSVQRSLDLVRALHVEREFENAPPREAGSRFPDLTGYYVVRIPPGADLHAAMVAMGSEPDVDHVEPIGIHAVDGIPNDPYYLNLAPPTGFPFKQWHYWDTYGIGANTAWDVTKGDPGVLVGILDTGIKYRHTDLGGSNPPGPADNDTQGNIWVNRGEVPGNGIDDDLNGYIDDVIGYDFVDMAPQPSGYTCIDNDCGGMDNDPNDGNGHGTHVAGTVAAITNNARSVAGVAGGWSDGTTSGPGNGVKLVPCRIGVSGKKGTTTAGFVYMDAAARAMNYLANLVDRGYNVAAINCSWGSSNTGGMSAAVANLLAHDVMIMSAAGNSNTSLQTSQWLTTVPGVMSVGATDSLGVGASFSNFGPWVTLAAPGVHVLSTYHDPTDPDTTHMFVALLDGTSMATPHAVGVAALLESYNAALTRTDKFNLMVNHTMPFAPANTKALGTGIVNAQLALAAAPSNVGVAFPEAGSSQTLALRASPNPARQGSDLFVRARAGERVRLAIVDAAGREIRAFEGLAPASEMLRFHWDGVDRRGGRVPSGLYFVRGRAGSEQSVIRFVVLQ